jgi:hypothetical protein
LKPSKCDRENRNYSASFRTSGEVVDVDEEKSLPSDHMTAADDALAIYPPITISVRR